MNFSKLVLSVMVSALVFTVSCGGGKQAASGGVYVSFFAGDVRVVKAGGKESAVSMKAVVTDGDIYRVGEKSLLILSGSGGLTVRIEAGTEAVIKSVEDIANREIFLNQGRILSSLDKLKKNERYTVKTKTTVASVRGTQFITKYDGGNTTVAVVRGSVSVMAEKGKEEIVASGKTGVVGESSVKVEVREINSSEKLEGSKFGITPSVENIEKKTPDELKKIFRDNEESTKTIDEKIDSSKGMSLADMKKKFGRVDVVTLYNGRVITGVITSRGAVYSILTTRGVVAVKASQVRNTRTQ